MKNSAPDDESRLWRGAAARLAGVFAIRAIGFVKTIVFVRIFFPDDLGAGWLCLTIAGFLSCWGDQGFHYTIIRAPADRLRETVGASMLLSLGSIAAIASAGWLLAPVFAALFSQDLTDIIRFSLIVLFAIPLAIPRAILERNLDFHSYPASQGLLEGTALAVTVSMQLSDLAHGPYAMIAGQFAGVVAAGWLLFARARKHLGFFGATGSWTGILRFGLPYTLYAMGSYLTQQADKFLLGATVPARDLAIYNTMMGLPQVISAIIASIDGMLFPLYVRVKDDREKLRQLFDRTCKAWAIVGTVLGMPLVLFAEEIIRVVFGAPWVVGALTLKILAASYMVRFATGYGYDNLVALRARGRYMAGWSVATVVLIVTAGAWMIGRFGMVGAAIFWLLQALIFIPIIRIPIIVGEFGDLRFLAHVWQPVVASLLAAAILTMMQDSYISESVTWLFIKILAFLAIYGMVLILLDRDTRQVVQQWHAHKRAGDLR